MLTRRAALATALATTAAPTGAQAPTLQVTAAPASNPFGQVFKDVAAAFARRHPDVAVEVSATEREFEAIVQRTLREATVGALPDVSFQASYNVRVYADRGLSVPLDPFLAAEPNWKGEGFTPAATTQGEVGGAVHALGFGYSVPIICFNADLVRRAGGDPARLPPDWPDILELGGRIRAVGPDIIGGFFEHDVSGNWSFMYLLESLGGRMTTPDESRVAFDGPEGLRALELIAAIGRLGQAEADMSRDQARQVFIAGKLGFLPVASSNLRSFERQAAGRFEVATLPLPIPAENGRVPGIGSVMIMFTHDPERQRAAWQLMKFAAGPDGQTVMGREIGWVPVNERAVTDPERLGRFYAAWPTMQAALSQTPRVGPMYAFPGATSIKIFDVIKDHLRQVVTLRRAPDEALRLMAADVNALLPA